MSTSLMYHSQGIQGFQHQSFVFEAGSIIERIERKALGCPFCHSAEVNAYDIRRRRVRGVPYGTMAVFFEFTVHRVYCRKCRRVGVETLPFLSRPDARITSAMERTLLELRPCMSIKALSDFYGIDWRVIKNCEKAYLSRKYKTIKMKHVKVIGIDEISVGRKNGKPVYITVVRDLESGAVLHVGDGKGGDALKKFLRRLRTSKAKIEVVAMDMGKAFIAWVKAYLKEATIVFDHFHVIKLMNDKLDKIRRAACEKLDQEKRELLKNSRFLFLRNVEDLDTDASATLKKIKSVCEELANAHMMKEDLRAIYRNASSATAAEAALKNWCAMAKRLNSDHLAAMAKTIESHLAGIVAFWNHDKISNAAMEGFNNKIRWLIKQAYGYRDKEYFHWKIFDLPNLKKPEL